MRGFSARGDLICVVVVFNWPTCDAENGMSM